MNAEIRTDTNSSHLKTEIDAKSTARPAFSKNSAIQESGKADRSSPVWQEEQFDNQFDQNPSQTIKNIQIATQNQAKVMVANEPNDKKVRNEFKQKKQNDNQGNKSTKANTKKEISVSYVSQQSRQSPSKSIKMGIFVQNESAKKGDLTHAQEMELKIKQIARLIRERVKKQQQISTSNDKTHHRNTRTKDNLKLDQSTHKIRDVILSPINKTSITLTDALRTPSKLITFDENSDKTIDSQQIVREIVKRDILGKIWDSIDLSEKMKRNKLKLDPIKHKYPITTFRKAIMEESKHFTLQEEKKLKERQEKLLQRRIIYNSSRYDRYIKQGKNKKPTLEDGMVESIVLLKQNEESSIDLVENPESVHIDDKNVLFTTEINPAQAEIHQINNQARQLQQVKQDNNHLGEDEEYNQDFL